MKTKILIVISSCLFGLLLIEMTLRFLFPVYLTGYIGAYQYDEEIGTRLKSHIHFLRTTDYQEEVYTNKIGSVNFQDTFDNYQTMIFAIGDSYTQGTGLPSDGTYPFQLDLMLNTNNDEYTYQYGIVNLGIASFGTDQAIRSLLMYKDILRKHNYIIYLGCSNDYRDDILFQQGYRHRHFVDGNPHYWNIWLKAMQWITNETETGKR